MSGCITEDGSCVIKEYYKSASCYINHRTKQVKFIVVTNYLNDLMNYTFMVFEGSNSSGSNAIYIVIGILLVLIAIFGILFYVLKTKKGITFKQFITCQWLRKKDADEDYSKLIK